MNYVCAIPCNDMGAGTFGEDLADAIESAADWLGCVVDDSLESGRELPAMPLGPKPKNGGKVIAVAASSSPSKSKGEQVVKTIAEIGAIAVGILIADAITAAIKKRHK